MIRSLLRNYYFMIGLTYVLILLCFSLGYHFIFHDVVDKVPFILNNEGKLAHAAFFTPLEYPPFGTDFYGISLFSQFVIGAKYTIGVTLIICLIRVAVSIIFGSVIGVFIPKLYQLILPFVNGYKYYPAALLCFFIVLYHHDNNIWFVIFLLAGVAVPTTSLTIAGEMKNVLNKPFIECSEVLGASKKEFYLNMYGRF